MEHQIVTQLRLRPAAGNRTPSGHSHPTACTNCLTGQSFLLFLSSRIQHPCSLPSDLDPVFFPCGPLFFPPFPRLTPNKLGWKKSYMIKPFNKRSRETTTFCLEEPLFWRNLLPREIDSPPKQLWWKTLVNWAMHHPTALDCSHGGSRHLRQRHGHSSLCSTELNVYLFGGFLMLLII